MTLSPYPLAKLLLSILTATLEGSPTPNRLIWTISAAPFFCGAGKWRPDTFKLETKGDPEIDGQHFYCQSKSAISQSRMSHTIRTGLFKSAASFSDWIKGTFIRNPVSKGVLTPLYAGTSPEVKNGTVICFPFARLGFAATATTDEEERQKFAEWCDKEMAQWLKQEQRTVDEHGMRLNADVCVLNVFVRCSGDTE
ncbi:hypothetical protein IAR55_000034 [Kwoniella newhampshirensis]|uniref:Decapping nuclease n=1 Tax=Kwoniella newhampshirensis TaxID=1651941 RepID=A0AAW0Z5L1_9TREE